VTPVFFAGGEPNDITRTDVLDEAIFRLHPPRSRSHDQSLTKGMSVPRCACAWLKRDARARYERGFRRLKQWIDAYGASKSIDRPLAGCLRSNSLMSKLLSPLRTPCLLKHGFSYVLLGSIFTVAERVRLLIIG
jgi:hypothetical protein